MLFLVATVTPHDARGRVDLGRLRAHVLWLASEGVDGFVPTGTTGEFPYLTEREREAVHRAVLDAARGRPVYPFVWDPSPTTCAWLCHAARDQGASGVFVPPPLHYALEDDVVERWYRGLAEEAGLPVLASHDPERIPTGVAPALYHRLRAEGVLAGLEDASGDEYRLRRVARADPGSVYSGRDELLLAARGVSELGGVVSSLANAWPSACMRLYRGGEAQLERPLLEREARVRAAGGLRALKALLRMGCRSPLDAPSPEALDGLPPSEFPA